MVDLTRLCALATTITKEFGTRAFPSPHHLCNRDALFGPLEMLSWLDLTNDGRYQYSTRGIGSLHYTFKHDIAEVYIRHQGRTEQLGNNYKVRSGPWEAMIEEHLCWFEADVEAAVMMRQQVIRDAEAAQKQHEADREVAHQRALVEFWEESIKPA
jgi:hypothetical protein